jgi:S-adenosylmethionine hydrolase
MIITLTTDFGYRDSFVGTMKGVVLGISPEVRIIDLTHGVSAGDIRGGAFTLMTAAPYFPEGTIHVAVVDPGVGSTRLKFVW